MVEASFLGGKTLKEKLILEMQCQTLAAYFLSEWKAFSSFW